MRKVLRIDSNGFFLEDVLLDDEEIIPSNCVEIQCPDGFYKPKWTGSEWIEGLTKEEIDTIKNQPQPKTEEEKLRIRISALEDALMQLI